MVGDDSVDCKGCNGGGGGDDHDAADAVLGSAKGFLFLTQDCAFVEHSLCILPTLCSSAHHFRILHLL